MIEKRKYKDISDTMRAIKTQIRDSLPFACKNVPQFSKPSELWHWLKDRIEFKNDPPNTELLQTMQTLFKNNFHGSPGLGDCHSPGGF